MDNLLKKTRLSYRRLIMVIYMGLAYLNTFRTYNGHPFLLDDHLERLNAGLKELCIDRQFHRAEVLSIVEELSHLNDLQDSYIRFNVSAGHW